MIHSDNSYLTSERTGRLVHRTHYDADESAGLTVAIVEAIAEATSTDSLELTDSLFDSVDPDALERVFDDFGSATAAPGYVLFSYGDNTIRLQSDGCIEVFD